MQFEFLLEWLGLDGRDGQDGRDGRTQRKPARVEERQSSAADRPDRPDRLDRLGLLKSRLAALGLPAFERIVTHQNEQVMLSWLPGKVLRIHEGYAAAPDQILQAIVRFVSPGTRRPARLAAKRAFLAFPVDQHAPPAPRPARRIRVAPQDRVSHQRLVQLYDELNRQHFEGKLQTIPIRISGRMRSRLGELRLDRKTGAAVHIGISRRHIKRDGWVAVTDTLLHEMVHQWQAETGVAVDHGRGFRAKARLVGIEPRAVRRDW